MGPSMLIRPRNSGNTPCSMCVPRSFRKATRSEQLLAFAVLAAAGKGS